MMKPEAWIILVMFGVILYLVYRNNVLTDKVGNFEKKAWPVSGEIKYPLTLVHLQQITNEATLVFDESHLASVFFGIRRTLKKLGLTEDFEHELWSKIAEMRYTLEIEQRHKEILECGCSSNGDEVARGKATDQNTEKIMNLTAGLQNAERLLKAWRRL